MDKIREACRAAASYDLLLPESNEMKENLVFYRKIPNTDKSFFVPRNVRFYKNCMSITVPNDKPT